MLTCRAVDDSHESRWDAFVDHLKGGPYLYFAWKKAVEKAYNHKGFYLVAEEGDNIVGLFPLVLFNGFSGKSFVSLPFCDYGGVLALSEEVATFLFSEVEKFLETSMKVKDLEVRFPSPPPFFPAQSGEITKVRLILELPPSADILWKNLKAKVRSQVRRPTKDGAKALLGGMELLPAFYRVYLDNMHYLGSPPHSEKWFKEIMIAYGSRAKVGVVHLDGEPLAAGILLCSSNTVTIPWASSRREYKKLSPNMLLYWTFLSFAADNGFKFFDFGRSSPGSGTYRFKKQWGAKEVPLYWYVSNGSSGMQGSIKVRSLIENIWRHLPKFFVNRLGPHLRSRISL